MPSQNTGEELWRKDRDEIDAWATPLVVEHDGVAQVITAGRIVCEATISRAASSSGRETADDEPHPLSVAADGVVYLTSGYRGNALRAIRLADAKGDVTGTSAVLWEHNRDTPLRLFTLALREQPLLSKIQLGDSDDARRADG